MSMTINNDNTPARVTSVSDLLARYAAGERDFRGADLSGANLRWADLNGANLRWADLNEADLSRADLRGADLHGVDLSGAYLRGADLSGADLSGADLNGADLRWATLTGATLSRATLSRANLRAIRTDVEAVLATAPREAPGVLAALEQGRVNGSQYAGVCACLVGTIANLRGESYMMLTCDLRPDARRPAERWFLAIQPGDTPDNSLVCAITAGWVREWIAAHHSHPAGEAESEGE